MIRLRNPVPFARVANENRLYSITNQPAIIFLRLLNRDAPILQKPFSREDLRAALETARVS